MMRSSGSGTEEKIGDLGSWRIGRGIPGQRSWRDWGLKGVWGP